jgi:hypothetical protein
VSRLSILPLFSIHVGVSSSSYDLISKTSEAGGGLPPGLLSAR